MKIRYLTSLSFILSLGLSAAGAQTGKSRAEVRAELDEAMRLGQLLDGTTGQPMNLLYPGMYPQSSAPSMTSPVQAARAPIAPLGKTRAEVKAELNEAIRTGSLVYGEHGETLRDLYPHRYPSTLASEPAGVRVAVPFH